MKRIALLVWLLILCACSAHAQRTIALRNLWCQPQVHVQSGSYTISFSIKDINRALELLAETGDSTFGTTSGLDTAKAYSTELFPGNRVQYQNKLQPLLQQGVGAYLLSAGKAIVENDRGKKLAEVKMDIQPIVDGGDQRYFIFYDTRNNKILFSGYMNTDLYGKDMGLDY